MIFTSLVFLVVFLPLCVGLNSYFKDNRIRNIILFIFSIIFYSYGEPKYIFLILFSIIINYFGVLLFEDGKKKKNILLLIILIIFNIAILGYYKYCGFFVSNINKILKTSIEIRDIVMPIGISFYTFQILSYVIDAYFGRVEKQKNPITLATYILLFPQLVAGPIVRYQTVERELTDRVIEKDNLYFGSRRLIVGLAKKIILANQLGLIVDTIYDSGLTEVSTILMWIASVSYMLQIYYDFSGYSDMAIGIGKMLGFNFNENFNYPYEARSITDFWRRWHMSLSSWFRDYVYIPLGGNRVNKVRWIINIFVVWGLTGLWHGAAWSFVLWGIYFAVILIIEKQFLLRYLKNKKVLSHIYALTLIFVGWIIFRSGSISTLVIVIKKLVLFDGISIKQSFAKFPELYSNYYYLIPASIFSIKINLKINNKFIDVILLTLYFICLVFILSSSYNPFIYFRF